MRGEEVTMERTVESSARVRGSSGWGWEEVREMKEMRGRRMRESFMVCGFMQ